MATRDRNNSLLLSLRARKLRNIVVREVRDRESYILGRIVQPHDGTEAGVIAAAETATERMYCEFATASNGESRICATDATDASGRRCTARPTCVAECTAEL